MTVLADYTADNQRLLLRGLQAAAVAVAAASPGRGRETAAEGFAAAEFILDSEGKFLGNTLIGSILFELNRRARAGEPFPSFADAAAAPDAAAGALETLRALTALLVAQSPAQEGHELREWLLEIAQITAAAGMEGGNFLGWGAVAINDAERSALAAVAQALNLAA